MVSLLGVLLGKTELRFAHPGSGAPGLWEARSQVFLHQRGLWAPPDPMPFSKRAIELGLGIF